MKKLLAGFFDGLHLLTAAFLSYLGPFTYQYRVDMLQNQWAADIKARELPLTPLGLGVTETAAAFAFRALGFDGGAEATMLVRVVFVAIALGGAVALLWPAERGARCDSAN